MAYADQVTVANGISAAASKATGSIKATVTSVKSSAGTLFWYRIDNPNTSMVYFQMFDAASPGSVTLGTTAPTFSIGVPASGSVGDSIAAGISFTNGIQVAVTTTRAGSTAPSSNSDYNVAYT